MLLQQFLSSQNPPLLSPSSLQEPPRGPISKTTEIRSRRRRRRRIGLSLHAVEKESEFELDTEKAREALKKLDQQLQELSQKEISSPKRRASSSKLDPTTWSSIILRHARLKNDQAILDSYTQMESLGVQPDNLSLPVVLKACSRLGAVERGKKIHSHIQNTDLVEDVRVRTALIDFYCGSGLLQEARRVFEETTNKDVVSWNAMICGHARCCHSIDAIMLFMRMQKEKVEPSCVTLVSLLSACSEAEFSAFRLGQEIHCYCLRRALLDLNPHVGTALISFYSRIDVWASRVIFYSMGIKNTVSWNALISGFLDFKDFDEALRVFVHMLIGGNKLTEIAILVAVQCCIDSKYFDLGQQIHQLAIKFGFTLDLFIMNSLLNMYGKNADLESSRKLFETIPKRDVALWNSMVSIYRESGYHDEAFALFGQMESEGVRKDATTISLALLACIESDDNLRKGKSLHAYVIKNQMPIDVSVGNALLNMYAQLNCTESVQKVFYDIRNPDVVSWNTLILALARNKLAVVALSIFLQMQQLNLKPNSYTMVALLATCRDESNLNIGRAIHGFVMRCDLDLNASLCTALTDMYMKCGKEDNAQFLFEKVPNRDLISWNALISTYVENNQPSKALLLFHQMLSEVDPNSITIINALSSCGHLANLPQTQCIHAYAIRRNFTLSFHIPIGNTLITTYARCGSLHIAEKVFRSLPKREVVSWNAMIAAYGMHGQAQKALMAFSQMQEDGFSPTSVTFVSVLSACSHAGLIETGWKHFQSMSSKYDIKPEVVHYACMVDLLGRSGYLNEASEFIESMPVEPDACVWRALLGACRVYSDDVKLARSVFGKLIELEPLNIGNYILLSNIYAGVGLWEEVRKLRMEAKEKNLTKPPGISWIVVRSQVHKFTAGNMLHPQSDKIYGKLKCLTSFMKEHGYVPDLQWALQD